MHLRRSPIHGSSILRSSPSCTGFKLSTHQQSTMLGQMPNHGTLLPVISVPCSSLTSLITLQIMPDTEQCVTSSLAKSYSADKHLQAITWEQIRAAASQNKECQELLKAISNGFPTTKETLPEVICHFWSMRDELYSIDGVILKGEKILIPLPLRAETLECLHATHQDVNGMLANA